MASRRAIELYDKSSGETLLVGFDSSGHLHLRRGESGWRTSWDLITAGPFIGNHRDQVLRYIAADGFAELWGIEGS